jgi:hypothetical protein
MASASREAVFDFEFLRGRQNETVVKELCVASATAGETFRFNHKHWCTMPRNKFPKISCATKTAHSLFDWLIHHLQTKDYVQCPSNMSRHTASLLQHYKADVHICLPYHNAKTSRRNRSSAPADSPDARKKRTEELEPTPNICTYWPNNPAFDPKRVLFRRLFCINEDRTKYVSVGFYPARDYLPLVEFGVLRRAGALKP